MILKIGVIAIVGVIILAIIKNNASQSSSVLRMGILAVIFISVIPDMRALLNCLDEIGVTDSVSTESIKIMIKIFAVLTIGAFCSSVCRDSGENAVADTVELSSKIIAVSYAIPIITSVVSVAIAFLR